MALSPFLGPCSLGELTTVYMAFIRLKTSDNSLINFLDLKLDLKLINSDVKFAFDKLVTSC